MKSARINVSELWLKYFSLGGGVGEYEVEAYLQGLLSLPLPKRDLLAMAANELVHTFPQGRAPYSDELAPDGDSPRKEPGSGTRQLPESED